MRQKGLAVKKSRSGLLPDDTVLCPLNKPTAAICMQSTPKTLPWDIGVGSDVLVMLLWHIYTSAAKSDLSILPSRLVSSDLGVKGMLLPEADAPSSASSGAVPELGSKDRLPEPEDGFADPVSSLVCLLVDLRVASSAELGSKARVVAGAVGCRGPYSERH